MLTNNTAEKSVFISYRRDPVGKSFAGRIADSLNRKGFRAFLDVDSLNAGDWKDQLVKNIIGSEHFLLVLTPGSLIPCNNTDDMVLFEYLTAKENNRNIIPIKEESKTISEYKEICPVSMKTIFDMQILELRQKNFQEGIEELIQKYIIPRASLSSISSIQYLIDYPKIPVNKYLAENNITDTNSYDLLTLLCLNRRNGISLYGHEKDESINVVNYLNELEQQFFEKGAPLKLLNKRVWLSIELNSPDKLKLADELNKRLQTIEAQNLGILVKLSDIHSLSTSLRDISLDNPTRNISLIIDCPTRNIDILKTIQKSLRLKMVMDIYISNQISVDEIIVDRNISIFEEPKCFENIIYYLQSILAKRVNFKELTTSILLSFEKIKKDLINSNSPQDNAFSPKDLVADFEYVLAKPGSNKVDWQNFFVDLVSVCNTYTPEFIEYLIYYSAQCKDEFMRFSSLKFALENSGAYLVDYWIEGTNCDAKYFQNISKSIKAPLYHLLSPILRYYNRHKDVKGLNVTILNLINQQLDGKHLNDYWLAEMVLNNNTGKFPMELLGNYSTTIIKLVESGVDIFEEADAAILYNNVISEPLMEKIILSTKMTSRKISIIIEYYPYLILN